MGRELDELEAVAAAVASPVVFAHNDLLSGNILIIHPNPARGPEAAAAALAAADSGATEPESKEAATDADDSHLPLQFIDFEYSAYTYRGYGGSKVLSLQVHGAGFESGFRARVGAGSLFG